MKQIYKANKSGWTGVKPYMILLFFLIVPLIILIFSVMKAKRECIIVYEDKLVLKDGGLFNQNEKVITIRGIDAISVKKTFWGSIFNYGTITIDVIGKHDIYFEGIKNPAKLKSVIEEILEKKEHQFDVASL